MKRLFFIHVLFFVVLLSPLATAQENFNIQPVSRIFNHWDRVNDFAIQGDLVYIAAETSGLQIVDISNPEEPRQLGYWDENPAQSRYICVEGNYAYISEYYDVLCIDISDPMNPQPISSFHFEEIIDEIYLLNGNIFVVLRGTRGGRNEDLIQGGMAVLSFENPEEPVLVNQYRLPEEINLGVIVKSYFSGNLGFMNTTSNGNYDGVRIFDLSEADNILEVGLLEQYRGSPYRYGDNLMFLSRQSIRIYDIQDLPEITLLGEYFWENNSTSGIATVIEDVAYVSNHNQLLILDISNPEEIVVNFELNSIGLQSTNLQVLNNYLIGSGISSLKLIDINEIPDWGRRSEPNEIPEDMHNKQLTEIVINHRSAHLFHGGRYSYRTVDVQNPQNPFEIVWDTVFQAYKDDTIAFKGYQPHDDRMNFILKSYNVADPDTNVVLDSLMVAIEDWRFIGVNSIQIEDNTAIIQCISHPPKLLIIDISDPESMSYISELSHDYNDPYFFTNGRLFIPGRGGEVDIFSFEDADNPRVVSSMYNLGSVLQITGNDNNLLIMDTRFHGLSIYDIFDIEDINLITEYRFTRDGEYGYATENAYMTGTHLYLSRSSYGIDILDIEDIENPVHVGSYNTPGKANSCILRDNLLYVADETNMGIYDISEAMYVEPDARLIPSTFGMNAYPNPFNSSFRLNYDVNVPGQVGVKIYDLRGRVLYNQDLLQGLNTFSIDGSNWATGAYFVNIEIGGEAQTLRVNCLK